MVQTEKWRDELTGQEWDVHARSVCSGPACAIHAPSNHPMTDFKRHMRSDRYLMERVCLHGIGHPDPDHLEFVRSRLGGTAAELESIHGCDGCCRESQ